MKLSELKPGMFVEVYGLILEVVLQPDKFYTDSGHINFISLDDAYTGKCSCGIGENYKFKIRFEKGSDEYKKALWMLIRERQVSINDAQIDVRSILSYTRNY